VDYRGQQVFVFHPDARSGERIVEHLRQREYEAYGLDRLDWADLNRRRDSVVCVQAEQAEHWDWKGFPRHRPEGTPVPRMIALNTTSAVGGYDESLTAEPGKTAQRLAERLDEIGARGHRRHIRFGSQNSSIATFDFQIDDRRYAGIIHDISTAGMSGTFRPEPETVEHWTIPDLHLNLPGNRISASARLSSRRIIAGQRIHVFHFDRKLPSADIDRIHEFIYASLETKLSLR